MNEKTLKRQCTAVITFALIAILMIAHSQSAAALSLKQNSVITGETITLGDIFQGLSHDEGKVLGPAPRPGHDIVLNARTLMRIALALDLPWRPASSADYVVLSRAASVVERDTVETALKEELSHKGISGLYNLIIPSEMVDIILPLDQPATVEVSDLRIKRENNWFEATLNAPSKDNPLHRSRISGKIEPLSEIPVLKEAMRAGTVIGKHDIEMITVSNRSLGADLVVSAADLIGTTPRRLITPGQPVKVIEIEAPKIVERGEFVTMIFNRGPLQLTARGKALENGAKGDTIRVVNTSSNKTVEGLVTASKEVTVQNF